MLTWKEGNKGSSKKRREKGYLNLDLKYDKKESFIPHWLVFNCVWMFGMMYENDYFSFVSEIRVKNLGKRRIRTINSCCEKHFALAHVHGKPKCNKKEYEL